MAKDLYGRDLKTNDIVLAFNIIKTSTPKIDRIITKILTISGDHVVLLNKGSNRVWTLKSSEIILMSSEGLKI